VSGAEMMAAPSIGANPHEIVRNIWPHHVEQSECGETLIAWYNACQSFADDLISQVEADEVVKLRDDDWRRRVSSLLTGARKTRRQIERRAAILHVNLPAGRDKERGEVIDKLQTEIMQARSSERDLITAWMLAVHGDHVAAIAEEIRAKAHVRWLKENREAPE
jgi:hypothetical protein